MAKAKATIVDELHAFVDRGQAAQRAVADVVHHQAARLLLIDVVNYLAAIGAREHGSYPAAAADGAHHVAGAITAEQRDGRDGGWRVLVELTGAPRLSAVSQTIARVGRRPRRKTRRRRS